MRPYILEETNWSDVKHASFDLAILSWGATEAHNYHLPYGTDNYQVKHIVEQAAEKAWDRTAQVIVLPHIAYGINTGQMDIKLCMNVMPSTQFAVLKDIAQVLQIHKVPKLLIVNGHGGNHFKNMIRELSVLYPDLYVCAINWYQTIDTSNIFNDPGDHAGELETSIMMHIAPELVLPLSDAGDGQVKMPVITAFQKGWVQSQRPWTKVSKDTGVGDPALSTKAKGEKYLDLCIQEVADFMVDLASISIDELYQ